MREKYPNNVLTWRQCWTNPPSILNNCSNFFFFFFFNYILTLFLCSDRSLCCGSNSLNCPWSACALLALLPLRLITFLSPWWKSHDIYASFVLDGFQISPFFHLSLFIFFSFSVCLSMVYEVNEVHDSKGWGLEGWGVFVLQNDKISEVHVCAFSQKQH